MRSRPSQPSEPIVAYRWFQVGPGGALSGAQDVEWPADGPMQAHHVGALEDAGGVLRALVVLLGAGVVVCAVGLLAGVALLAAMVTTGSGTALDRVGAAMLVLGAGWGFIITLVMGAMAPHPGPRPGHVCPAPAPRLAGRWTPACGIYAYADLAGAVRGTRGAWVTPSPLVVAEVLVWGAVYEHRWGYRAEQARVEALYDDGSGQVELPAARYGVPTRAYPAGLPPLLPAGSWSGRRLLPRLVARRYLSGGG